MTEQIVTIILVEDDDVDARAVERALRQQKLTNPVLRARNGDEGLELLRGRGEHAVPRPHLVLLDLNMPLMSGIEFLQALRHDPVLSGTVVFVLTTSNEDRDKVAAYENQIAGYIVKSSIGEGFDKLVTLLDNYWRLVEFPP